MWRLSALLKGLGSCGILPLGIWTKFASNKPKPYIWSYCLQLNRFFDLPTHDQEPEPPVLRTSLESNWEVFYDFQVQPIMIFLMRVLSIQQCLLWLHQLTTNRFHRARLRHQTEGRTLWSKQICHRQLTDNMFWLLLHGENQKEIKESAVRRMKSSPPSLRKRRASM